MIAILQYLKIRGKFQTPHHEDECLRIHERYVGLKGQMRIALVDAQGRVWHYDLKEVVLTGYEGEHNPFVNHRIRSQVSEDPRPLVDTTIKKAPHRRSSEGPGGREMTSRLRS